METLISLESMTQDLKKELWDLKKNIMPSLEAKIIELNSLKELNSNIKEIENDLDGALSQIETLNSDVESTIIQIEALESQLTTAQSDIVAVQGDFNTLNDHYYYLISVTLPNLKNKYAALSDFNSLKAEVESLKQSSGDWTTVYDMHSEDEALNWAHPTGLTTNLCEIEKSVDFSNYNFIRVFYCCGSNDYEMHEFSLREGFDKGDAICMFSFVHMAPNSNGIIAQRFGLKLTDDNRRIVYMDVGKFFSLNTKTYTAVTGLAGNNAYHIYRIDAKV